MIISFASGKGGTGKTLLATNLAHMLSRRGPVTYVDADVEEPNGHLFLGAGSDTERATVTIPKLVGRCTGCGACQQACAFNAILAMGRRVMVFAELCHSCGACVLSCPQRALMGVPLAIGSIERADGDRLRLVSGRLDLGQARATPLVEATVQAGLAAREDELIIVDCPPGTSCSAMAAVKPADLVVLVTEPTPFGLHDLQLAVEMCRALDREVAAVVNRADLGDERVFDYLWHESIPVLGRIPFEHSISSAYARGTLAADASSSLRLCLEAIATRTGMAQEASS